MKIITAVFIATTFLSCKNHSAQRMAPGPDSSINNISGTANPPSRTIFRVFNFDSTAIVKGCANVYLQKFSNDLRYELLIDLDFDSIPKLKKIDISNYAKFIRIIFNEYAKGNQYIDPVCNDAPHFPKGWREPKKYPAISGDLMITYWSDKENVVSVIVENLIVDDSTNQKMIIPFEAFNKLTVHWVGG